MDCGLLGRTLGHSYSPAIHRLLGDYSYTLFEKEPEEVEDFLRHGAFQGLNVTIPYKKTAAALCDDLSPLARRLGSVNTLVRRADGTLYGDNTDAWGFQKLVEALGVDCRGKKALVLGTGGASVTVQAVLADLGARVVPISRTGPDNYTNLDRHRDAALLVNATPVGMAPRVGETAAHPGDFPRLEGVLDLIYNPARTRLLLEAEALGIPHLGGLTMLVHQALRASSLWTGQCFSPETAARVCSRIRGDLENLVLIGMPGCGKSTLGQRLSEQLGRPFVDADREFEQQYGSIPDFFAQYGEEAFRKKETEILSDLGKRSGLILATGGGCVTREENYNLLHQNGTLLWLRRDPKLLSTQGRPLSQKIDPVTLYEQRKAMYQRFADAEIDNNGTVEETLENILHAL